MNKRKSEIATILMIGAVVVMGVTAVISSFTQQDKRTTSSRASQACVLPEKSCGSMECFNPSTQKCVGGKPVALSSIPPTATPTKKPPSNPRDTRTEDPGVTLTKTPTPIKTPTPSKTPTLTVTGAIQCTNATPYVRIGSDSYAFCKTKGGEFVKNSGKTVNNQWWVCCKGATAAAPTATPTTTTSSTSTTPPTGCIAMVPAGCGTETTYPYTSGGGKWCCKTSSSSPSSSGSVVSGVGSGGRYSSTDDGYCPTCCNQTAPYRDKPVFRCCLKNSTNTTPSCFESPCSAQSGGKYVQCGDVDAQNAAAEAEEEAKAEAQATGLYPQNTTPDFNMACCFRQGDRVRVYAHAAVRSTPGGEMDTPCTSAAYGNAYNADEWFECPDNTPDDTTRDVYEDLAEEAAPGATDDGGDAKCIPRENNHNCQTEYGQNWSTTLNAKVWYCCPPGVTPSSNKPEATSTPVPENGKCIPNPLKQRCGKAKFTSYIYPKNGYCCDSNSAVPEASGECMLNPSNYTCGKGSFGGFTIPNGKKCCKPAAPDTPATEVPAVNPPAGAPEGYPYPVSGTNYFCESNIDTAKCKYTSLGFCFPGERPDHVYCKSKMGAFGAYCCPTSSTFVTCRPVGSLDSCTSKETPAMTDRGMGAVTYQCCK